MKHILLSALVWCSFSCFASGNWTSYFSNQSVQVLYRFEDCHDETNGIHQQKVFFCFVNLTGKTITISFTKELTYTGKAASTGDKSYTLTLKPGETLQGDCSTHDKTFFSFAKHLNMDGSKLEKFDLKNITVTSID